jgi:hypothetical protein
MEAAKEEGIVVDDARHPPVIVVVKASDRCNQSNKAYNDVSARIMGKKRRRVVSQIRNSSSSAG